MSAASSCPRSGRTIAGLGFALSLMLTLAAPSPARAASDTLRVAAYHTGLATLLDRNGERGPIYIADRMRSASGGWVVGSELPAALARRLSAHGIAAEVIRPAEMGYHAPGFGLFFILGEIRFGPENRIAEFDVQVGSDRTIDSRVKFKLKRDGGAWRVLEWQPEKY